MKPLLSKTKYLDGIKCPKLLWHYYNAKEEIPETDEDTLALFEQGKLVGNYAKKLFSGGIEIEHSENFGEMFNLTKKALITRKPLFEAYLQYENSFTKADISEPVEEDKWDIIEVKSSTEVKDINIEDAAFQKYIYENAGLKIRKTYILHINNNYIKNGQINLNKLFTKEDVTDIIKEKEKNVPENIKKFHEIIALKKCPIRKIGDYCYNPYKCPLTEKCFDFLPCHNPLTLYRLNKKKAFELINNTVFSIFEIPPYFIPTDKQRIQIKSARENHIHFDKDAVKDFLSQLKYPAHYLDFETFSTAIPIFDGSSPYQQIPFQFSLHIEDEPGSELKHFSFLASGTDDPRPKFLKELKKHIGETGSIVVYYRSFEESRLNELAGFMPEYKEWITGVISRIVDLHIPFKNFDYYNPAQEGSASIKSVLPAIAGKSYDDMAISNGAEASREYYRVTFTSDNKDKAAIRKNLKEYCALDTLGMVDIVKKLEIIAE